MNEQYPPPRFGMPQRPPVAVPSAAVGIATIRRIEPKAMDRQHDLPEQQPDDDGSAASLGGVVMKSTPAEAPPIFRRIINPADWEGLPVPPREWIVQDLIPHKAPTLLFGDGATESRSLPCNWQLVERLTANGSGHCPPKTTKTNCIVGLTTSGNSMAYACPI